MKLNGIYTALITPYHNDYSINEKAYAEVINTIIEEGVHGVVVAGSTGENYTQTLEERIHLLKLSSEIIDKRVTFIAGTGGVIRTEDLNTNCTISKIYGCRCNNDLITTLRGPH